MSAIKQRKSFLLRHQQVQRLLMGKSASAEQGALVSLLRANNPLGLLQKSSWQYAVRLPLVLAGMQELAVFTMTRWKKTLSGYSQLFEKLGIKEIFGRDEALRFINGCSALRIYPSLRQRNLAWRPKSKPPRHLQRLQLLLRQRKMYLFTR